MVDEATRRVIELLDIAIKRTWKRQNTEKSSRVLNQLQLMRKNLGEIREALVAAKFPPPGGGTGFGACRTMDDWGLRDKELRQALEAAEELYSAGR